MALSALTPPKEFIEAVGGGDFHAIGQHVFEMLTQRGGLKKSDSVLDIGSGCGRVAIPLTAYLSPTAKYHGIDVVKPMVDWCSTNITTKHPNFLFHHANLTNTLYSGGGTPASSYRFPFPDGTFDFVFLTSVFTHLKPEDTKNYLSEIRRVLKSGGKMLATFYLINAKYLAKRRTGEARVTFDHGSSPYWVNDPKVPEAVSAYDEAYALRLIAEAGMLTTTVTHGGWIDGGGWSFQDTVLAARF